jgi:glucose/arabinose dehydrogenase
VDGEPQDLSNAYGKILRVHTDGSIPADNPFRGREGVRQDLYAHGMRDLQGATIDPRTGSLWTTEHGPRGGDELNRQAPGVNQGFPVISYGREYFAKPIGAGLTSAAGMGQPVYFWTPSIAPSGLTFYSGKRHAAWRGNLFVAAMGAKRLVRLVLAEGRVVAEEPLLVDRCQRLRAVYEGPDGLLYVLTDEDAGQIWRVEPR